MKKVETKYNALWLSHSSISDFLCCPRLYYLKNIWKNSNGKKVNIVSSYMSLGSAVHQVIEPLSNIETGNRFNKDLLNEFENIWKKYIGLQGGFTDSKTEMEFKERGINMIKNVIENPGPLAKKTIKFYKGDFIPNIYLSEKENIILCGLVDWVEYLENTDSLKVLDFKTGRNDENEESLQLPIYKILVEGLQARKVKCGAYWYLDRDKFPKEVELIDEDVEEVKKRLIKIGIDIKKRKVINDFDCTNEDCKDCRNFELIKKFDEGEDLKEDIRYLGENSIKHDLYFVIK